jgi:hypothetical protein
MMYDDGMHAVCVMMYVADVEEDDAGSNNTII